MRLYSTNDKKNSCSLKEAVVKGLASDNGLFMPESIPRLPGDFFRVMKKLSFADISYAIAANLFQKEIPELELKKIVEKAIDFDAPLTALTDKIFSLELYHGPTLAFKDFGARFMAELLTYFTKDSGQKIKILVATSGDTGSAVANSFLGNPHVDVIILYPGSKVSFIQEKQLTTLGENITALEIKGNFDDCQKLVKAAFLDPEISARLNLSSANSINIARLIPQTFYYFYAFSRLPEKDLGEVVFSVPSGNFGNLTAGLFAAEMGLPVKKFIASTNINDTVPVYLTSGIFSAKASKETISNAMDVGNPSNFARMNDLFGGKLETFKSKISAYTFTDDQTRKAMLELYREFEYLSEPHGAVAYLGLKEFLRNEDGNKISGIFLETAHPAKFMDVLHDEIKGKIIIPDRLKECLDKEKKSLVIENDYQSFKDYLLSL
jgi:threonine synthase